MATFAAVAGTLFKYTVSASLTTIPGVGALNIDGGERKAIDVTAISDEDEVFIGGRRGFSTIAFPMYWDPADAGQAAMLADYLATTAPVRACTITEQDASNGVWAFSAYIEKMLPTYDKDGAHMMNVQLRITTALTFTP